MKKYNKVVNRYDITHDFCESSLVWLIPEWVDREWNSKTLCDRWEHDVAEAWLEWHHNDATDEDVYLAVDYDGKIYCLSDDFEEASNALGERCGFTYFWKKF